MVHNVVPTIQGYIGPRGSLGEPGELGRQGRPGKDVS